MKEIVIQIQLTKETNELQGFEKKILFFTFSV